MILYNGVIYTVSNDIIQNGYVEISDGKITAVGSGKPENLSNDDIDLNGATVYPGFIDSHTHLGMWEDGLTFEGDDGNEETDPVTPQLRAIDAVNPMETCFREALESGVTAVMTGPGSANAIGGQLAVIKTYGKRIDKMIVKAPAAMKMALGENPKTVYHGKEETPMTRMATASLIREQLFKAREYAEGVDKYNQLLGTEDEISRPDYDLKLEALMPVVKRELPVHFHAHRADDIFTAMRIAEEFNLDYVIVHGTEGHLITDELKSENARVISGPLICDRSKPELKNHNIKSPGIMSRDGISLAICTDHPCVPIQYLRMSAGLAVSEGLDYGEAIKAITLKAAENCGVSDRLGSIDIGKDADLVVFDADPLSLGAKPTLVMVNGKICYEKEIQSRKENN